MRATRLAALTVVLLVMAMSLATGPASAGDFSPKLKFGLSNTKVKANPEMTVHVEQEEGEEELAHVTLRIPKGFKIPGDEAVEDGDVLGTGEIVIESGPGCHPSGGGAPTAPSPPLPAELFEQDRSDEEADRGVYAVWVLDISGVTKITLLVTGSRASGFTLDGDIPANAFTCPPFSFDLTINQKSDGGVTILKNPKVAGKKKFSATFFSQDSPAKITLVQPITIKS
ncbi:MAG: hypothetical protein ACRDJJ_09910 [Actinomycetota bacterium]